MMLVTRQFTHPLPILMLLCTGYALSFFQRVYPSVLAPELMESFALDGVSFSLISSATMLGYAITQVPSGILADVFGGKKTLAAYQILAGMFCILFTFCGSLVPAVVCRFLIGLTLASNVPSYKILAAAVPANRYAFCSAVLTACGAIGSLMAASPLVAAVHLAGWRATLLAVGVFTVFLGLVIMLFVPDYASRVSAAAPAKTESIVRRNVRALFEGVKTAVRMRTFWLVFLWFMFMIGNYYVLITTWLGSYLMQGCGLSKEAAGLSISVISLLPLPFMLVIPWCSDRVFRSRKAMLIIGSAVQSLILLACCLCRESPYSFAVLTAAGTCLSVFTGGMVPIAFTMIKESVPSSAMASAIAVINASGPVFAAVMQGIVGGAITRGTAGGAQPLAAYANAFLFLLAGSVISLGCALFMRDTLSR